MMQTALRGAVLTCGLLVVTGCGTSTPASPTPATEVAPVAIPRNFPQPSGNSRSFAFDRQASYSVSDFTTRSRFDLYDNGAFVLTFPVCTCPGTYRGTYTETNETLTFEWEGWSLAGPWGASATLQGDILTVKYNEIMQLSDFENAVYRRIE